MSAGRREVAHRLFAAEYDDASLEYAQSDEERAPNYVATPTGARVNRLFVVGVLTSVEQVNEDTVRARIADPTGAFVVYAGQYQPDEHAALQAMEAPAFVAVTGKANTFQPDGSDRVLTSVRPESVTEVDAETRDRWVVTAAEHTLARIETIADALDREQRGEELSAVLRGDGVEPGLAEGVARAIDHYGTTPDYLGALREVVLQSVEVVTGEREEAEGLSVEPGESTGEFAPGDLRDVAPPGADALAEAAGPVEELEAAAPSPADGPAGAGEASGDEGEDEGAGDGAAEASGDGSSGASTGGAAAESAGEAAEESPTEATEESPAEAAEESAGDAPDASASADAPDGDTDGESDGDAEADPGQYELDEDEREEVEAEHGVEFQSGNEVDEPGEAGIEPEAESGVDDAGDVDEADDADESAEVEGDDEPAEAEIDAEEPDETEGDDEPAEAETDADESDEAEDAVGAEEEDSEEESGDGEGTAADLESVLLEEMERLDEGEGADREELVDAVATETGAAAEDVQAAIDDALMSGKCYEPAEDAFKPI